MMLKLEDLEVYKLAMKLGEQIWTVVDSWSVLAKDTIGKQLIRSADSVAANIAEGYGRYHFKENKLFSYYGRGSLLETKCWLEKAQQQKLLSEVQHKELIALVDTLHLKLNAYMKSIGTHS